MCVQNSPLSLNHGPVISVLMSPKSNQSIDLVNNNIPALQRSYSCSIELDQDSNTDPPKYEHSESESSINKNALLSHLDDYEFELGTDYMVNDYETREGLREVEGKEQMQIETNHFFQNLDLTTDFFVFESNSCVTLLSPISTW